MRKSKLGIQCLNPADYGKDWIVEYRPRVAKLVIVNYGDYAKWMPEIPGDVYLIARYLGQQVDLWEWSVSNAKHLAAIHYDIHKANGERFDAFECINEPIVHTPLEMQKLAEFNRVWALELKAKCPELDVLVGSFSVGNPADISLMKYFAPALKVADYLAYHGYGCPEVLSDAEWYTLRYRKMIQAAGVYRPTILTEFGIDCGAKGHGWRTYTTERKYLQQLKDADSEFMKDNTIFGATIFAYGQYGGWPTFELSRWLATRLGDYIVEQGDIDEDEPPPPPPPPPPEEETKPFNADEFANWLRPQLWTNRRRISELVAWNPDAALFKAARAARLGFPLCNETIIEWEGHRVIYQAYAQGFAFCLWQRWHQVWVADWFGPGLRQSGAYYWLSLFDKLARR